MKKVLTIVLALVLVVSTAGCGTKTDLSGNTDIKTSSTKVKHAKKNPSKETVKTYTNTISGISMTLTYYLVGDKIVKQTARNVIKYRDFGKTKDELKPILEAASQAYQGIDGVQESIEYGEEDAVETLSVDFSRVDLTKLKNIPGINFDDEALQSKTVSMKKTEAILKKNGFTLQS